MSHGWGVSGCRLARADRKGPRRQISESRPELRPVADDEQDERQDGQADPEQHRQRGRRGSIRCLGSGQGPAAHSGRVPHRRARPQRLASASVERWASESDSGSVGRGQPALGVGSWVGLLSDGTAEASVPWPDAGSPSSASYRGGPAPGCHGLRPKSLTTSKKHHRSPDTSSKAPDQYRGGWRLMASPERGHRRGDGLRSGGTTSAASWSIRWGGTRGGGNLGLTPCVTLPISKEISVNLSARTSFPSASHPCRSRRRR